MIDLMEKRIAKYSTYEEKFNSLREFCQLLTLKTLDELGGFKHIAFVGGTALRILYDLNRFSEDLDFCLIGKENYSFLDLMTAIEKSLQLYNLDITIKSKERTGVASAFIKFNSVLNDLNLSPYKDKRLMIKFEVDQRPPREYHTQLSVINDEFLIGINHFDLASLFAGKLHAVLCSKYTKGRDFYDLVWYLSKRVVPNFEFLNNAIMQTENEDRNITVENFANILQDKIATTNFDQVKSDVLPFLRDQSELRFFNKAYFDALLRDL